MLAILPELVQHVQGKYLKPHFISNDEAQPLSGAMIGW